jgi:pyruvate formate lyase activating enzyme
MDGGSVVTKRELCLACGDCVEVCYAGGRELVGREMTTAEVMREIEKDKVFFDQSGGGVTFSGGEPLLQHEFLRSLLQACAKRFIHTAVDTSGYVSPAILELVSRCVDLFLFDLKTLDDVKHREYTGVSNRVIVKNLRRLAERHKHIVVRIPVIPGFNDGASDVQRMASFVSSLGTVNEIHLLPYHKIGIDKYHRLGRGDHTYAADTVSAERMSKIAGTLRGRQLVVSIGG